MTSLSARLLATLSMLLIFFFGITIATLDIRFRDTGERAIRDLLQIQLIALLAAAEPDEAGSLIVPDDLPEARFANPGSGLYGQVDEPGGRLIWRSASAVGVTVAHQIQLAPGERYFGRRTLSDGTEVFALSLGIEWELEDGTLKPYLFSVAESKGPFEARVARFRRQLLTWFSLIMAILLLSQAGLLRWVLAPLRRAETEVAGVEAGQRSELGDGYPTELQGLTANMNALIKGERARLTRYRESLGNLAHSLKTPLAVMRNLLEERREPRGLKSGVEEQLSRIDDIVKYQLHRASAGGAVLGHAPVPVAEVLEGLVAALDKVYRDRALDISIEVAGEVKFFGDRGDLTEMAGNLMDNACKWSRSRVRVSAGSVNRPNARRKGLELRVEDDGPGIDEADVARVLDRGARADERVPGHGLGLAMVSEIVELYGGSLAIRRAELGGAGIEVLIPPR